MWELRFPVLALVETQVSSRGPIPCCPRSSDDTPRAGRKALSGSYLLNTLLHLVVLSMEGVVRMPTRL